MGATLLKDTVSGGNPIDPGTYHVSVNKVGWVAIKNGPNKGQPQIALQYTIMDEGDFEGRYLFQRLSFSERAAGITLAQLETLAPDVAWNAYEFPEGFDDAEGIAQLSEELFSREVQVVVELDPKSSDPKDGFWERVKRMFPAEADLGADGDDY